MTSTWVEEIKLSNFRNYVGAKLDLSPSPVIITGANGAGKTNLLEAVSLLAPGQGLRRASYDELSRATDDIGWAVAARVQTASGAIHIGTGIDRAPSARGGRLVRIDHQPVRGSGALADYLQVIWLTPAMDGLFTGAASERRRFLDRLVLCFQPTYRKCLNSFERAMRHRNRLLDSDAPVVVASQLAGLEQQMAEMGVAVVAARREAVSQLDTIIQNRRQISSNSPFPWASITLEGTIESWLDEMPARNAEQAYLRALVEGRHRDKAAKRTLSGPHRSDMLVGHGPKAMPAKLCSTGEQKALLINLVLAHASLLARCNQGSSPILLLDEIAAHLDLARRSALFDEIMSLGAQAWMTGTDRQAFDPIVPNAQFFGVEDAEIIR